MPVSRLKMNEKEKLTPLATKFSFFGILQARIQISAYLMCIAMTMYPGRIFNGRSFPA